MQVIQAAHVQLALDALVNIVGLEDALGEVEAPVGQGQRLHRLLSGKCPAPSLCLSQGCPDLC